MLTIKDILAFAGGAFVTGVILGIIIMLIGFVIGSIKELKYSIKRKRRFNRKPIASCYCKDCMYWHTSGKCDAFTNKYTADDSFCSMARPRKNDPDKV